MRVSVVGVSGAGKSTFGRTLAERIGAPFVEFDSIRHQPGWTELPDEEFAEQVSDATAADAWVVDGNYDEVRSIVVARATDVVWIDPRKAVVMAQVVTRSIHRAVTRRELWNGNGRTGGTGPARSTPSAGRGPPTTASRRPTPSGSLRRRTPTSACTACGAVEKRREFLAHVI